MEEQVWQDELARLPRRLYPEQGEAELRERWQRDYEAFFSQDQPAPTALRSLFAPVPAERLQPHYIADPAKGWYALVTFRYNPHTRQRLGYLRYWGVSSQEVLPGMIRGIMQAWQEVPFEGLKLRLGDRSPFRPADFHPQAIVQEHIVVGRLSRQDLSRPELSQVLKVEYPAQVEERWWQPYYALRREQKALAPEVEDWHDDPQGQREFKREMGELLQSGGGVANLWEEGRLIGHISWRPSRYPEQLLELCWHINQIIITVHHRRRGLGEQLHRLAAERMNLVATPYVAGIISAGNIGSLRAAAKMGREVMDSYIIIPKYSTG